MSHINDQHNWEDQEEYKNYWARIQVPIEPVDQLKTAPFREEYLTRVKEILSQHGCRLDHHDGYELVTFPRGTTKQEILPRLGFSQRYRILLPDGYEIIEVVAHSQPSLSALGFGKEDLPDLDKQHRA